MMSKQKILEALDTYWTRLKEHDFDFKHIGIVVVPLCQCDDDDYMLVGHHKDMVELHVKPVKMAIDEYDLGDGSMVYIRLDHISKELAADIIFRILKDKTKRAV